MIGKNKNNFLNDFKNKIATDADNNTTQDAFYTC